MKKNIFSLCFMIVALNVLFTDHSHAQKLNETVVTFLCDATDQTVFDAIETDFRQNLNVFFTNTSIGAINYGQRLTIRMGVIDESDQISLSSKYIAITDKKVSRKEAERLRNPRPLLKLINDELSRGKQLSERKMTSSPIIDITLKVFREMSTEARNVVVICTDGVEYSNYANFYKNIPSTPQSIEKLISKIDSILLDEAKEQISSADPEVVVVLKPNDKVKRISELKVFYKEFFYQLGVNTIKFIDNLNNNPNL